MFEAPQKLRKTGAEKDFLKSISALERSHNEEKDASLREIYSSQIKELKSRLANLSGLSYLELDMENARLGRELSVAKAEAQMAKQGKSADGFTDEQNLLFLYRAVMKRYGSLISEKERKTVGEIKAMVSKDDLTVQSLVQGFKPATSGQDAKDYTFENDYPAAAERAFNYVRDQIRGMGDVDIGISFWLTATEIVSEKMADDEDKAILLCSTLYALGDELAECVIAELENNSPHAFVITELSGKFLLLDPSQGKPFLHYHGLKSEVMQNYSFNGFAIRRFLYRFNNANYEQFS